ncbi:hypothetical protein J3F83DRAFT_730795 [Trichoderma novae-zelandiae]
MKLMQSCHSSFRIRHCNPSKMAGVDKLHVKGIKGKGVKIGIIDTGVDYMHASLGGGFGKGYKDLFWLRFRWR